MGGTIQSLMSADSGNNLQQMQNGQSAVQSPVVNEPLRTSALQSPVVQGTPLSNLSMYTDRNYDNIVNQLNTISTLNRFLR